MQGRAAGRSRIACVLGGACGLLLIALLPASAALAVAPKIEHVTVSAVSASSVTFEADISPNGSSTTYRFEYGIKDCEEGPCASAAGEAALTGSSPVHVKVSVGELQKATVYHYRTVAENGTIVEGKDHVFATPSFPFSGLPDERAYEQASPVDKDGGDALGQQALVKASESGDAISFGSTFGVPGGKGAQELPFFLASRGEGSWLTRGLLPPFSVGQRIRVMGWLPDYSQTFIKATRLGNPRTDALVDESTKTGVRTVMTAYRHEAEFFYVGASADASIVLFEALVALPAKEGGPLLTGAIEGAPNLYAWERATGEVHLVGVDNDGTVPGSGSIAGPYDWVLGSSARNLREGGATRSYYLQGTHAVTQNGSAYFTAAGSGQLYLRRNPTAAQSAPNGQGKCADTELACTFHVSASRRTPHDPAGEQPAAFQGASEDGSKVFFTSHEMLTNQSNTGPEQAEAQISRDTSDGNQANLEKSFIPKHAIGIVTDSEYIYWVDPTLKSIGRAKIDGEEVQQSFIAIPEGECASKPGVEVPSAPRYLAVNDEYVYWTNTGLRNSLGEPIDGGGTIGRAKIDGEAASVEPDFICGASNPQGIAVSKPSVGEPHIYWANAAQDPVKHRVSRALLDGTGLEENFFAPDVNRTPYGLATNGTHLYGVVEDPLNNEGYLFRIPLDGGGEELRFIGEAGLRGVTLDAGHVYWVAQEEEAIGRANLGLENRENEFIPTEGTVSGLAATTTHLLWTVNGEAATNPGTDLYLYEPGAEPGTETLTDLTVDTEDEDGAEVQGVLGVSEDGSRVYVAANGDLDGPLGPGTTGNCKGIVKTSSGHCGLYLLEEGQPPRFIAKLSALGGIHADSLDWVGTPVEALNTGSYEPRSAFLGEEGRFLLFRSQEQLTPYDNEGVPEFYRYSAGDGSIACVSCRPNGEAVGGGPSLGSTVFPGLRPSSQIAALASRNFSASGGRAFFETTEALVPEDTNGAQDCLPIDKQHLFLSCTDVYEWEAPDEGSCEVSSPSYSPLNSGCLYLISTGKSKYPSLFADASASGEDVFFFTRQQLVRQDEDELQDVYDARVGGGLAAQNAIAVAPCESAEACHGPAQVPPSESSPTTPGFIGPQNPKPQHKKPKHAKKHRAKHKKKNKGKQRNAKANKGRSAR